MSALTAALTLYRDCAVDSGRALLRSAWALAALVLAAVIVTAVAVLVSPLGLIGGFIVGILQAVMVGWYLSLVEIGVSGRRRVTLNDLRGNIGAYWQPVISVLFLFWIGSMILGMTVPQALPVAVTLCTLLFNPTPEMIYSEHSESFGLLGDAVGFMQHNWPEWLGGVAIGALFLGVWGLVALPGLDRGTALALVQMFGPFFGFMQAGSLALTVMSLGGLVSSFVLLAFTHWFLLFRGHLYQRLRRTSRRSRAWQQRLK